MKRISTEFRHKDCQYYISEHHIGFNLSSPQMGEHYTGNNHAYHNIIFLLEGELEFSYNDFIGRKFTSGDIFFVPQATEIYGTALTDSHMLVLTFNTHIKSFCDNCLISSLTGDLKDIKYDFKALRMTEDILLFAEQMKRYINKEERCRNLHDLKQKELFIILQYSYTPKELIELFYPAIGGSIDFKSRVRELSQEGLSIKQLAQKFNMSQGGFSNKFQKEFGKPVRYWLLEQKAKQIKLKLSIPGTTFAEIIQQYNFTDMSHLNKFCKEHFGCTPTELQRQLRRYNCRKITDM